MCLDVTLIFIFFSGHHLFCEVHQTLQAAKLGPSSHTMKAPSLQVTVGMLFSGLHASSFSSKWIRSHYAQIVTCQLNQTRVCISKNLQRHITKCHYKTSLWIMTPATAWIFVKHFASFLQLIHMLHVIKDPSLGHRAHFVLQLYNGCTVSFYLCLIR